MLWEDLFNNVNQHHFNQQRKFEEPLFINDFKVTNEEIVRQAININILMALNRLTPDYEFSMRSVPASGIPDYTRYDLGDTLSMVLEIKRTHVLNQIKPGQTLPEFYKT